MLLNNFFYINDIKSEENSRNFNVDLVLNKQHEIYNGHFPENPIVPGVCLIQIIKEVLSKILNKDLLLFHSDNLKFMSVVNPEINNNISANIKILDMGKNIIRIESTIFSGETIFFKFKGNFKSCK